MTAQLVLPETHHVTGGEWLTAGLDGDGCPYELPTLRVWWWPVDGEWEQNDSVGLHGTDEFGPPADLVKLAEPCDTCPIDQRGWVLVRDLPSGRTRWEHCPDCYRGKRIVQLVEQCPNPYCRNGRVPDVDIDGREREPQPCQGCWDGNRDGTVSVARVTITLLPVYDPSYDFENADHMCVLPNRDATECYVRVPGEGRIALPFKVEPGQWVVKAEEVREGVDARSTLAAVREDVIRSK